MLKRDMFVRRHEEGKPIFGHEFFYPLMQGYDSVAMDIDVELEVTIKPLICLWVRFSS